MLVTVPIILDQAVGYCFHFFISLLFIVPIILDQDVGIQNHQNSYQQPDPKSPEQ
jgi:hypothetical protein